MFESDGCCGRLATAPEQSIHSRPVHFSGSPRPPSVLFTLLLSCISVFPIPQMLYVHHYLYYYLLVSGRTAGKHGGAEVEAQRWK